MLIAITAWIALGIWNLFQSSLKSTESYFVLGGNITREIHVADLVAQHPTIPTLISTGSPDPCIWNAFNRAHAPMNRVWLEKCAESTFGNMYYAVPILKSWHVSRVTVITSRCHLPRAKWLAQIILGAHGIWTDFDILEDGFAAKPEMDVKTWLDVTRAIFWTLASQFYSPSCPDIMQLSSVDMNYWNKHGYHCAHHINPETGVIENDSVIPDPEAD